jgi:hypothetical protein
MVAIAIGILAARVAIDEQTPVEQVANPITHIFGGSIEIIGYGVVIALIILALGYVFKKNGKG